MMRVSPISLSLLYIVSSNIASAAVLNVLKNSFDDLEAKLGQAVDKDIILIPPGKYIGKENGKWPKDAYYNSYSKDICNMVSDVGVSKPNLIIRGTGNKPSKVKLIGITMTYCDFNLVVENLSMFFCGNGNIVEHDNDEGLILRDVVINTPYESRRGIYMMSHRVGIIDSRIQTYPPLPGVGMTGLAVEGSVTMLNSVIKGYQYGVVLNGITSDPNEWKIYNNDLTKNKIECSTSSNGSANCNSALSAIAPNTPTGTSPYDVSQFIDILHFKGWPPSSAGPYIPVVVRFPEVLTSGETTIYRLPGAYPEPPSSIITSVNPQYFQFDSTATLGKKAILKFNKIAIDNEFIANVNIQVHAFKNGGWIQLSHVIQGGTYKFTFPTKEMKGLIAFFAI